MKTPKTINAVISEPWAATPEVIYKVLLVVNRLGDPEALRNRSDASLERTRATSVRNGVAIVSITGPLVRYSGLFTEISGATSYSRVAKDLGEAVRNPEVKSILLDINSGGGSVDGCQELAGHILDARKVKPVNAYIGGTGCSAAYWLASACEKIYAAETSVTGSIGVQLIVPPEEKDGSLSFLSSHSPNKNATPHGEKGKTEAQRIVDDLGEIFVKSVAENRGISKEEVLKNYGQGSVFVGPDALERGMVDEITTIEKILSNKETTQMAGLTAGKVKEEHPEAYNEIFKLGADSIDREKIKSESVQGAQDKERERVTGILDLEGSQATTKQMIAEGKSVGAAAVAFRKEEVAERKTDTEPQGSGLQEIIDAENELNAPSAGVKGGDEATVDSAILLFEKAGGLS